MTLMISEVYDALCKILPEAEARKHAIVLSDPGASHATIAATFREMCGDDDLAERAAKAMIDRRSHR